MGKFDIKSMFSKEQIDFIFKLTRANIPRPEMELILNELEFIIREKDNNRAEIFFEEVAETHKIDYSSDTW